MCVFVLVLLVGTADGGVCGRNKTSHSTTVQLATTMEMLVTGQGNSFKSPFNDNISGLIITHLPTMTSMRKDIEEGLSKKIDKVF